MKDKKIIAFIIYLAIMIIIPYIVFAVPIPRNIVHDAGLIQMAFYLSLTICCTIAVTVGFIKCSK